MALYFGLTRISYSKHYNGLHWNFAFCNNSGISQILKSVVLVSIITKILGEKCQMYILDKIPLLQRRSPLPVAFGRGNSYASSSRIQGRYSFEIFQFLILDAMSQETHNQE